MIPGCCYPLNASEIGRAGCAGEIPYNLAQILGTAVCRPPGCHTFTKYRFGSQVGWRTRGFRLSDRNGRPVPDWGMYDRQKYETKARASLGTCERRLLWIVNPDEDASAKVISLAARQA